MMEKYHFTEECLTMAEFRTTLLLLKSFTLKRNQKDVHTETGIFKNSPFHTYTFKLYLLTCLLFKRYIHIEFIC